MLPTADAASCNWSLNYNPYIDAGLELFNDEHKCSLATTYRMLTDPSTSARHNDTMFRTLHRKIEAGCIVDASDSSSRLQLIERAFPGQVIKLNSRARRKSNNVFLSGSDAVYRAYGHLQARALLGTFARLYSHLQEAQDCHNLLSATRQLELDLWHPDCLTCFSMLALWLSGILVERRYPGSLIRQEAKSHMCGFLVLSHCYQQYIAGTGALHTLRVASLLSLSQLINLLASI